MVSRLRLARKYLHYYLSASNGRGHGIHSPFVFDFVTRVLNDTTDYPDYARVEALRSKLLDDRRILEIEDLGAGSAAAGARPLRKTEAGADAGKTEAGAAAGSGDQVVAGGRRVVHRRVADLARHAAKPPKLGQLLFRIALHYRPGTMLELGTSLGLSAAYLASGAQEGDGRNGGKEKDGGGREEVDAAEGAIGNGRQEVDAAEGAVGNGRQEVDAAEGAIGGRRANLLTIEGAAAVAAVAEANFRSLGLDNNIELVRGAFDERLPAVLDSMDRIDLAFVDGNHRQEPTLRYFNLLMGRVSPSAVLIFDDIHWSGEMEGAWAAIKGDPRVLLTIDLFFIGLVFLREDFKVKQDFVIRF